jgi:hypothetical protein
MWTIQIAGILVGNLKTLVFPWQDNASNILRAGVLTVEIKKQLTLTQERAPF